MNRIKVKEKVVTDGEIETRFAGKNLTPVGGSSINLPVSQGWRRH